MLILCHFRQHSCVSSISPGAECDLGGQGAEGEGRLDEMSEALSQNGSLPPV